MLSVVIPCRNGAREIAGQLEALSAQTGCDFEVVVADNGSTDNTRQVAERFAHRLKLRVVDASEQKGRAFACNVGAWAAHGEAVAFVDADDEVAPGYVAAMASALANADVVAARLDCETLNDGWWAASCRPFQVRGLLEVFDFLPFALGCSIGVSKRAFEEVGGFAYDVPFAEDVDFCWLLQLHGFSIKFVPEAVVRRRYRDTMWGLYRQTCGYGLGQAALFRKYRSLGMPGRGLTHTLAEWYWMLRASTILRTKPGAGLWVHMLGYRVGRLKGRLRYRALYP